MPKPKKKRKVYSAAAVLTIHDAGEMTARGAREVAAWLRRQARHLDSKTYRGQYASRHTARYLY